MASSSSLPHDTDGADRKGRVVTIQAIPSKTSSKKAELSLSKPSSCQNNQRAELSLFKPCSRTETRKKKLSLFKPCPCQEKKEAKKKAVNITIQAFKMIARENFHGFQLGLCTSLLFLPRSQGKAERRRRAIPQILTLRQRQLIQQCQVDQCWLSFPLRAYARYGGYCK